MDIKKLLLTMFFSACCVLLGEHAQGQSISKNLSVALNVPELIENQGYLMVYVNVEGIAPSLELSKINTNKTDFINVENFSFSKDYRINLKNVLPGFYFIPMLAGVYQITRINAPFYDLPYWLPTEKQAKWRFAIEKDHINFIGELYIAKERETNEIDIHLFNRFAMYQKQINSELAVMAKNLPLKIKPGYPDEFLQELNN